MTWELTDDVEDYLTAAGGLLGADPVGNTLPLTVVERARARPGAGSDVFGWWRSGDGVTGAVSHTPPYGLLLVAVPDEAARPLVDLVVSGALDVTSLSGPTELTVQVAALWAARSGGRAVLGHAERLHRLGVLTPPEPPPPGRPRAAAAADRELLEAWLAAFADEAGVPRGDVPALVADRLSHAGLLVWEDAGRPVALAALNRPAGGVARIGPVYTPVEDRRRGYAGAATTEAARSALVAGARDVVLFTDLANPTSNALYRRLGFLPVSDRVVVSLQPG